jgi:hypothetical protein
MVREMVFRQVQRVIHPVRESFAFAVFYSPSDRVGDVVVCAVPEHDVGVLGAGLNWLVLEVRKEVE